jgi:hypothetical protein
MKTTYGVSVALLTMLLLPGGTAHRAAPVAPASAAPPLATVAAGGPQPFPVAGSAVLFQSSAVVHSEQLTDTGMIQRSTAAVKLTGDVNGWILFHPTSVFDFVSGSLVNTGTQIFAGTIADSDPVILHDNTFRFDIDLPTGATIGDVFLSRSNDAPHKGGWFECHLAVVGTGATPEGDLTSGYTGTCVPRGR